MVNTPYENYMGKSQQNLFNNQFLKCRPVSSKEQAQALQIDLDGSLWVFTDIGNEKIYTKQINADGTASFKTSQMKELEAYLQELSTDITEMIRDASPEEKATLHQKMTMLANKIA